MGKHITALKGLLRMFRRARHVERHGFRKYQGTPQDICRAIIDEAYDERQGYFRVSSGHFCEFFTRDFAFCCESLVDLGYEKEVRSTLEYALRKFKAQGRVMTLINPEGIAYDYPRYGPDSLALLLYSITHTGNTRLAKEHHAFLQGEVDFFVKEIIDPRTRLPYRHKRFTCMRDHAKREASCYDAVMVAVVARECRKLKLKFPYSEEQLRKLIIRTYWNGTYFFDDLKKQPIVIGDSNVFPFWTGIITDKTMLENATTSIQAAGLDDPFPLRYVSPLDKGEERVRLHFLNWFAQDYETDSLWIHMGLAYIRVLAAQDPKRARKHLEAYRRNILAHRNFLEVYDTDGGPFHTSFYWTDESMLWCANWLLLDGRVRKAISSA